MGIVKCNPVYSDITATTQSYGVVAWRKFSFLHSPDLYIDLEKIQYDDYLELMRGQGIFVKNCALYHTDTKLKYVNIKNNIRHTTDHQEAFTNYLYVIGASYVFGTGSPDAYTIPSFLQRECNKHFPGQYRVMNYGIKGTKIPNSWLQLHTLPLKPGDCVILLDSFARNPKRPFAEYVLAMAQYCRKKECGFFFFRYPNVRDIRSPSTRERMLASYSYQKLCEALINGKTLPPADILPSKEQLYADEWARLKHYPWAHDLQPLFDRPHDLGEVFLDMTHVVLKGNQAIAEAVAAVLRLPSLPDAPPIPAASEKELQRKAIRYLQLTLQNHYTKNRQIQTWLRKIPAWPLAEGETIGAIVMNCNPFTNGHLYLIETALKRIDRLYIFAVQEDLSIFPFKDRFHLMQAGTKHLGDRVMVIPSGKFIISSFSFPGYFTKEKLPVPVDASMDVALFGAVIAPALGITSRFAGEEPLCVVTREYNRIMRYLLPAMGVTLHVIPRVEHDGGPISASRVRALLAGGDMASIRRLVPQATYHHLQQMHQETKPTKLSSVFKKIWQKIFPPTVI